MRYEEFVYNGNLCKSQVNTLALKIWSYKLFWQEKHKKKEKTKPEVEIVVQWVKLQLQIPSFHIKVLRINYCILFPTSFLLICILEGSKWWLSCLDLYHPFKRPKLNSFLPASAWPNQGWGSEILQGFRGIKLGTLITNEFYIKTPANVFWSLDRWIIQPGIQRLTKIIAIQQPISMTLFSMKIGKFSFFRWKLLQ